MSSKPRNIKGKSPSPSPVSGSPAPSQSQPTRHASIARLSSPVPHSRIGTPSVQQIPTSTQLPADDRINLPALDAQPSLPGPGPSALSSALAGSPGRATPIVGTPPRQSVSSTVGGLGAYDRTARTNYGSLSTRDVIADTIATEDTEVVKRHLVQPDIGGSRHGFPLRLKLDGTGSALNNDEFSSLQLQGGDMTRNVYRYVEDAENSLRKKAQRSKSFHVNRPPPENEVLDINNIRIPGGFRRNFLRRAAVSPAPSNQNLRQSMPDAEAASSGTKQTQPALFTNNFIEFLTLYGHFAGEELEEDDENLGPDEYFSADAWDEYGDDNGEDPDEGDPLLSPTTPGRKRRKHKGKRVGGTGSATNAVMLLLKSFVGTGVLFLPRAFLNGGMLFSSMVLLGVAALSFYCFILLINTRLEVEASYGDIGGILYGKWMRALILSSIVLSQVGFVAAYTVFTSENLQAFVLAVSKCRDFIDIKIMILMQLIIFLPLSLIRDISKLGFTALIADAFIMLGLIYLYYYNIGTIEYNHGISDITLFNPESWPLFIGTAIFTFEGVGLIIPIQESMKQPHKFPFVLGVVMVVITILFTSIGALSYAAYGSKTKTVILLNLPQDNKMVNTVQFLYSLAILLSTPLQLFPAIRILENELFTRSGKYNPYIKWQKNIFRFVLVMLCALIAWGGAGDLDKFVSLVGSFACVPLVYVYPPLLHLKAVAKTRWQRVADYALCVFGVVGCAYTTVLTVQQWAGGHSAKSPGYCDS